MPPPQYHIHPLPQHYQHYLTSPRMHHFPRNNASTQVVSLFCLSTISLWVSVNFRQLSSNPATGDDLCSPPPPFPRCVLRSSCKLLLPVFFQVVHEIRNYPYPQLHLLALQSLNPSRHASAVRESYEVRTAPFPSADTPVDTRLSSFSLWPKLWTGLSVQLIYSDFQMPRMVQLPLISWCLFSCRRDANVFFGALSCPLQHQFKFIIPHLYVFCIWICCFLSRSFCSWRTGWAVWTGERSKPP